MKPKWMDKKESHRTKSDKRVKKVAKSLGGRVVSNSGATWFEKGDIQTKDTLIEHKYTSKKSYSLKASDIANTYNQALTSGSEPKQGVIMLEIDGFTVLCYIYKGGIK